MEAKDYDYRGTAIPVDLPQHVAVKVFDTLAGLSAISRMSGDRELQRFAAATHRCTRLVACLSIEFPRHIDQAPHGAADSLRKALYDDLRRHVRLIAHNVVVCSNTYRTAPWTSRRDPATRSRRA